MIPKNFEKIQSLINVFSIITIFLFAITLGACKQGGSADGGGAGDSNGGFTESSFGDSNSCNTYGSPEANCDCSHITADLPFNYSFGSDYLLLHTDGGSMKTMLSPWGAHTEPFTGHYTGNHKSDWQALYAATYDEMTELTPSNGNGVCEKGEKCGVHRSEVAAKRLKYVSPGNRFIITEIYASDKKYTGNEFQGDITYVVTGWLCNYRYSMGYISSLSPMLTEKLIEKGYDPYLITDKSVGNPNSNNFNPTNIIKDEPIILNKADEIGTIQLRAVKVKNHPDYFNGWGGIGATPNYPLEYSIINLAKTNGYKASIYHYLPKRLTEQLKDVFYAQAKNRETSIKYNMDKSRDWLWTAQMVLSASEPTLFRDHSSLFSWMGGWGEKPSVENCKGWEGKQCDEQLAIFKIHKNTPFYDHKLYDSRDVGYLFKYKKTGIRGVLSGEVITPSEPNPIRGVLTIKWRGYYHKYQRVAYQVEPHNNQMKVRWGEPSQSLDDTEIPEMPTESDYCDGEDVTCMDHMNKF